MMMDRFDKFEQMNKWLLPIIGEGLTMANQIFTAVNKLVYKWYNDGDVFDNVHSGMEGWANDLSSYANWLHKYCGSDVQCILEGIKDVNNDEQYEELLFNLADTCLNIDFILEGKFASRLRDGSVYDCDGPFEYSEHPGIPDEVKIDYDGTFVITTDEEPYGIEWFDTLDDAENWCSEKGVDYHITEEAEIQADKPEYMMIGYCEETDKFILECDDYCNPYYTEQSFYRIDDAKDFLYDKEIDFEIRDNAEKFAEENERW